MRQEDILAGEWEVESDAKYLGLIAAALARICLSTILSLVHKQGPPVSQTALI